MEKKRFQFIFETCGNTIQCSLFSISFPSFIRIALMCVHSFGFSVALLPAAGQAAGASARPGSDRGTRPAAEQRTSAPTVRQPGQRHRALDPDQDGGQYEQKSPRYHAQNEASMATSAALSVQYSV